MSESFTYLIEVSLFYSLFLCTGAEKMVCSQRRTEAGASHFFGLCSQTFMAQMHQSFADFGIIEDNLG